MLTYQNRIAPILEFIQLPLVKQRAILSTNNGKLAEPEVVTSHVGEKLYVAGMAFLKDIHQEIFDGKSETEKQEILENQRQALTEFHEEKEGAANANSAPKRPYVKLGEGKESDDYLISLGIDPHSMTKPRLKLAA